MPFRNIDDIVDSATKGKNPAKDGSIIPGKKKEKPDQMKPKKPKGPKSFSGES